MHVVQGHVELKSYEEESFGHTITSVLAGGTSERGVATRVGASEKVFIVASLGEHYCGDYGQENENLQQGNKSSWIQYITNI